MEKSLGLFMATMLGPVVASLGVLATKSQAWRGRARFVLRVFISCADLFHAAAVAVKRPVVQFFVLWAKSPKVVKFFVLARQALGRNGLRAMLIYCITD